MRNSCKQALLMVMSKRFKQARIRAGLTQAKFAEKLLMDPRSYAALELGKSLCGTVTFVLYLAFFCEDVEAFAKELKQIVLDACTAGPDS